MKTQKLVVIAAIVCLLVGASGAAMAEPSNCQFGWIANETVDDINVDGQNCYISEVLVLGDVTIRNGGEFVMRKSRVFGSVKIKDTNGVVLFDNQVVDGDLKVIRPNTAYIAFNSLIRTGLQPGQPVRTLLVRGVGRNRNNPVPSERTGEAIIFDNHAADAVIECKNVDDLAFARSNVALDIIGCPGQLRD